MIELFLWAPSIYPGETKTSIFDHNLIMETLLLRSKEISFCIYMLIRFKLGFGLFRFNSQTYFKSSFKLYIVVKIHYSMSQRRKSPNELVFGELSIAILSCAIDLLFGLGK